MPNDAITRTERSSLMTYTGLFVALFAIPLITQIVRQISPDADTSQVIIRELLISASAGALQVLVKYGEKLPFKTIGLGTSVWWKSVLWGLATMFLCGGAAVFLEKTTRLGGDGVSPFDRLPLWVFVLIIFRAGIVEELFYRGYAIEHLEAIGRGRFASAALPLLVFAAGHYTGGAGAVLQALVLGSILAGFYLWRRDLVANSVAHTLVDLVGTGALARILKSV